MDEVSDIIKKYICELSQTVMERDKSVYVRYMYKDDTEVLDKIDKKRRLRYGRHAGFNKWDLALHWLRTSNDEFFELYGFNFIPDPDLLKDAKDFLYAKETSMSSLASVESKPVRKHRRAEYIDLNEKMIAEHIKANVSKINLRLQENISQNITSNVFRRGDY